MELGKVEDLEIDLVAVIESQTPEQRENVARAICHASLGDCHLGHPLSTQVNEILVNVNKAFRGVVHELTSHSRKMKASHPHRPELRGSGVPRKRGKGKR